ncbi:DUF1654 domain-containing protein [Pseudomonas sp. ML96]|uniref:DUF1654 domain-containing protein n=1 Tax=Pseudomonas sp. ML96 TaxID=1523503 RepID=UPI0005BAFFB1|nr:DUF1654 domain-containing protein [Pseudomonas sp. ML96]
MAEQNSPQQSERSVMSGQERLALRISMMIGSPRAQLERWTTVHRLDTDTEEAWEGVMEILAETDGIEMTFNDDGSVTLRWALEGEGDREVEEGELEVLEDDVAF